MHDKQTATPFCLAAEDAIRCAKLTGVQTCALPISVSMPSVRESTSISPALLLGHEVVLFDVDSRTLGIDTASACAAIEQIEERRVGKECRCRGGPSHYESSEHDVSHISSVVKRDSA